MAAVNLRKLVLGLLFAGKYVLAANQCNSRLITCFAVPIDGTIDYYLTYDQLPDGSMSSLCNNLPGALKSANTALAPGCQILHSGSNAGGVTAHSNVLTFSVRRDGDTESGFSQITDAFTNLLQCDNNLQVTNCTTFGEDIPDLKKRATVPNLVAWMVNAGDAMLMPFGNLTVQGFGAASQMTIDLSLATSHEIAAAVIEISSLYQNVVTLPFGQIFPVTTAIANTSLELVTTIDFGLGGALSSASLLQMSVGDWYSIIYGISARLQLDELSSVAVGYVREGSSHIIDMLITMEIVSQAL